MDGYERNATISPSPSCVDVAAVADAVEAFEERLERQASSRLERLDLSDGLTDSAALNFVIAAARRAAPDPVAASLLKTSAHFSSGDFISGQVHENDKAEVVIVCEPDMASNIMGALHPAGSLYERPVNMRACTAQHEAFRAALRSNGVRCLTVRDILLYDTDSSVRARVELEDLAAGRLRYELDPTCDERLLSASDRFYIGDEYKKQVLECMSTEQLVDVILCGPTVHVQPSYRDTGFTARYVFDPLTNAQFTRDQQITSAKGIVLARLRSTQRRLEVDLMHFCFRKIGLPVIGAIKHPGYLEGGDFFPAGKDLCFIGVGTRSNVEACHQLMQNDLLGPVKRVAVVRDDFERDQCRMHLDTIFNIIGDDIVLLAADVMGEHSPLRRTVDEYELVDVVDPVQERLAAAEVVTVADDIDTDVPVTPLTRYVLRRSGVEFSAWLTANGFHIEPISREHQLAYGCNVLNLGDSTLLSCHAATARQIVRCPHFHGSVQLVEFEAISSMYGALHCSSQVVRRAPADDDNQQGRTSDPLRRASHPSQLLQLRICMRGELEASPSSGSGEEQKPVAGPNFVTRAGRLLLSQRADFSTIGATAGAALVISGVLTSAYTVLYAPPPKGVDLSDEAARAAHAAAKRRALQVGLRALATATAASAITVGAVAADVRTFVKGQMSSPPPPRKAEP